MGLAVHSLVGTQLLSDEEELEFKFHYQSNGQSLWRNSSLLEKHNNLFELRAGSYGHNDTVDQLYAHQRTYIWEVSC